jgi:hypothetical protein
MPVKRQERQGRSGFHFGASFEGGLCMTIVFCIPESVLKGGGAIIAQEENKLQDSFTKSFDQQITNRRYFP